MPLDYIFRTDLGDDEAKDEERKEGSLGGAFKDLVGDDDVDVLLTGSGAVQVAYLGH